ncbi:MAG: hypothetical protein QXH24_01120 [Candidatus Bathyarchaeia archaeon]
MTERWWRRKWYWAFCILSTFFGVLILNIVLFPEQPLSGSLIYAMASIIGVLIAYFAYMNKPFLKLKPKTLRRIITIMGGAFVVGLLVWSALVYLCIYLQILDNPVVGTLLGVAL